MSISCLSSRCAIAFDAVIRPFRSSSFLWNCTYFRQMSSGISCKLAKSDAEDAPHTIAALQLTSTNDKQHNFQVAADLIQEAANRKAKMIFLPENFDFIASCLEENLTLAESLNGPLIRSYQELAERFQVYLGLGGFHCKSGSEQETRIHNCHVVINPVGRIIATYHKLHLFDVHVDESNSHQESKLVAPGTRVTPPVDTSIGRVGLSVCYDLRFPQLSSCLREMGAELLTYPSAFTRPTGEAHWEVLLRARAMETQCYVVAAAQCGQHNEKRATYGHSMIVDPLGDIMAQCCGEKSGVIFANISMSRLRSIRAEKEYLSHSRRRDLFPLALGLGQAMRIGEEAYVFGPHTIPASTVFYRSLYSYAFVNISPLVPGHILVSPVEEVVRLQDLRMEQLCDLFACVHIITSKLEEQYGAKSLTISCQDGKEAGQTVPHVHIHMLPRKPGDFGKKDSNVIAKLQEHDATVSQRKFRSYEEMSEEALTLRTLFYH